MTVAQGLRNYGSHVAAFSHNARLFLISNLLGGVVISIYGLLFNFYLVSLGYEQDFLGLIASLSQLIVFLLALPGGLLSNWLGRKRAMVLSVALNTLSLLGLLIFTSTEGIVLMTLLYGASVALFVVSMPPFMIENSRALERTHLFSMNQAMIAVAGFAGGFIGGNAPALIGQWLGVSARDVPAYQAALGIAAIINAISLVPLFMLHTQPTSTRSMARPPLTGLRSESRLLLKLMIPNLLIACGAGLLIPFNNLFLRTRFEVSDGEVGFIFSWVAVVAGAAIAFGPVIAQRFGKVRAVVVAQALSVPLVLIIGFSPSTLLGIAAFLMRPALMQMSGPIFDAFTMEAVREENRATASSLNQMVWTLGWIISPAISGQIQVHYGWSPIIVGMAMLYAMGIAATQIFFGNHERATSTTLLSAPVVDSATQSAQVAADAADS